ncbi:MAG: hypothetical protein ACI37T_00830 [Candidatus Gastranaerophilaceae bacterium]
MALDKIAATQIGKFGSLTSSAHARNANSIFGNNVGAACSYTDSFNQISVGDNGSYDIFSPKGKANIEREMDIIKGKNTSDASKTEKKPRTFEMNQKALLMLQRELNANNPNGVSISS